MKIISISGSHRGVGKTTLARLLARSLGGRVTVLKVGHGPRKDKPELLLRSAQEAARQVEQLRARDGADYVLLEGNSARRLVDPDLAVFLEGAGGESGGARLARSMAHLLLRRGVQAPLSLEGAAGRGWNEEERRAIERAIRLWQGGAEGR